MKVQEAINEFLDCCDGKKVASREVPAHAKIIKVEVLPYGDLYHFADGSTPYYGSIDSH